MAFFEIMEEGNDLILKNKYGIYSRNELENQLKVGHFTVKELGEIYGTNMNHVLNVLGISSRNILGDTRILNAAITPEIHQYLIGSLLGDAYMRTPHRVAEAHSINQYEYLFHKAKILKDFIAAINDTDTKVITKKSMSFRTFSHILFEQYFNRFYSNGLQKKLITMNSVCDLEPLGLAVWYQDDGKFRNGSPSLCVGNISTLSGQILINLLQSKFGINSTFQSQNDLKGYYNIYILAESRNIFFNLVSPYIIPSMRYKLGEGSKQGHTFDPEKIAELHYNLCLKANRNILYSGDKAVLQCLGKYPQIKSLKDLYKDKIRGDILNKRQISRTEYRKILPDEKELRSLLDAGKTDEEIGFIYGISRTIIGKLRRKHSIKRRKCRLSKDQINKLKEMFLMENKTIQRVMKETHLSYYTVKNWLTSNV